MLTRIVSPSPRLGDFLDQLHPALTQPQQQHLLRIADALLVCDDTKTLAALQRQFLQAPDPSNFADFLRISPWSADALRSSLREEQVHWLLQEAQRRGFPQVLYINLDDSLTAKDKGTCHIEPVDWFHDHQQATRTRPYYKKGFTYVECTLRVGDLVVTVDLRLYLRGRTVRRINRQRPAGERIPFCSKNQLARSILQALAPLLPADATVFVQFDSWYASARLIKFIRRHGWHVVCRLKSNRRLNGQPVRQRSHALWHQRYGRVRLTVADGTSRTYYVRQEIGHLERVPDWVRVYYSHRHPGDSSPAYYLSTDVTRTAEEALRGFQGRWSCEVVNFYLKAQLGLGDFRVRAYEAVDRYLVVVHLAWSYVERRHAAERGGSVRTYGDIIRRHRDEHAENWLRAAVALALRTGSVEPVLAQFLRQPPEAE